MVDLNEFMGRKKHFIWDWNGTLLDDVDVCVSAISQLLKENGLKPISCAEYLDQFCFPVKDYYALLGFDFTKVSFEHVASRFIQVYQVEILKCGLHAGAENLLGTIKSTGKIQSILSAAHESHLKTLVEAYRIDHHFDHVFGLSDHYAGGKIERARQLMDHVGVYASETILIGDTDHDVEVGKSIGVEVVLLEGGHQALARIQSQNAPILRRQRLNQ